jgi:hypothetical protein
MKHTINYYPEIYDVEPLKDIIIEYPMNISNVKIKENLFIKIVYQIIGEGKESKLLSHEIKLIKGARQK